MNKKRRESLDELYRLYAEQLYYYLLKLSGSPTAAEDLVQETFVRATISLHQAEGTSARAWLYKVARNVYLDEWRRKKRWSWVSFFHDTQMISPYGIPDMEMDRVEDNKMLAELLYRLPENYRSIIHLREIEEMNYDEIAEALDMTEGQVKVTLHRARKKLQQLGENRKGEW
ncbi:MULTISPECIES: RNA polymerase sigma factor [Bacillus]|uniref:RNA polymerase sigma factor n=1 Tax=Bacillus TaxID=1386 RepID=UPI001D0D778D|nr:MULTISPECIES: sigma-70 family RNA polymerase sigma factor [Bacillus]